MYFGKLENIMFLHWHSVILRC